MRVPRVLAQDWPTLYGKLQLLVNAEERWHGATKNFLAAVLDADDDICKEVAVAEHAFTDTAKELTVYLRSIGLKPEKTS